MSSREYDRVVGKFRAAKTRFLWEGIHEAWLQSPQGWRRIADLPYRPVLLFADRSREAIGWVLGTPVDAVRLLEELPAFVVYASDEDCTGVLSFNDHDVLAASGTAVPALRNPTRGSDGNGR
ncbi:MAG: hypothetical protein HYS27_22105 [Deltaproteobacteria bacterium]|nr:hypothetical protein [Deltaproteobacteria bacterium]